MKVNRINGAGGTNFNNDKKDQNRFQALNKLDNAYNESSRFKNETGMTHEDVKRQRELRKNLGHGAFQAIFDGELDKYRK